MKLYLSLVFIVTISLFSCKPSAQVNTQDGVENSETITMKDISVEEAADKISKGKAIFIDVRTDKEIADGMIPGSIHLDINSPNFEEKLNELDKDKEYVVYCRSGGRSAKACKKMKELGFANLNNMLGGYSKWDSK